MLESDHSHSSFSLRRLGSRLRSIPALLMLLPFVAGVLLGDSLSIALWVVVGLFVVAFGSLMLLRHRALRRLSLLVVMLLTGYLVVELRGDRCEVATERELELVVRLSSIPGEKCIEIENMSKGRSHIINVALNYGGRDEIVMAVNKAIKEGRAPITADDISRYLYTSDSPDPDLIIRTGGEAFFVRPSISPRPLWPYG